MYSTNNIINIIILLWITIKIHTTQNNLSVGIELFLTISMNFFDVNYENSFDIS